MISSFIMASYVRTDFELIGRPNLTLTLSDEADQLNQLQSITLAAEKDDDVQQRSLLEMVPRMVLLPFKRKGTL
jgi:hypothetical protein